jgi:hypothetical protein
MKSMLLVFLIAFSIRFLFSFIHSPFVCFDSKEYYYNSQELTVMPEAQTRFGYSNWYERTPVYTLYLHITHQSLLIQMIISAVGVVLMWRLNPLAGLIWCFYVPDILHSSTYWKTSLLCSLIIGLITLIKDKRMLLVSVLVLMTGFISYTNVINYNAGLSKGFMSNVFEMWKPSWAIWGNPIFAVIQGLFFLYFIRNVNWKSFEVAIVVTFTIIYGLIYAHTGMREPLMPILILWFAGQVNKPQELIDRTMGQYYKYHKRS